MAIVKAKHYWFLDAVAGWQEAFRQHITLTRPEGYLALDPLPGTASLLLEDQSESQKLRCSSAEVQRFVCPSALAPDGCGNIFVVDAARHLLKRVRLASRVVETLPAIGGEGSEPRRLGEPRGVAVLPTGAIVVADTANHRVQIFSPPPYALLQVWGASDALGHPQPGLGSRTFRWPWAVTADASCTVYVVDRGNHRIQEIRSDGTWLAELGADVLKDPTRLALGPMGLLAVVDPGQEAVFLFRADGSLAGQLSQPHKPRSVAFDDDRNLYVGDSIGLIYAFAPDPSNPVGYRLVGPGVSGLDGPLIDLAWERNYGLLAIIKENYNGLRQRLWQIDPASAWALEGRFITTALDSKIERCQWHRILLKAAVPEGSSVQIDSYTSDVRRADSEVTDPDFSEWTTCVLAGGEDPAHGPTSGSDGGSPHARLAAKADDPDCLVQSGPGQYLWLRLTLRSSGRKTPAVRWLKSFFPRVSYLQYLPAVYQEDEESRQFLDRFLSIFQTEFDNLDQQIDLFWQLFDPASVAPQYLRWLAGWLALVIEPEWPVAKIRQMLKDAIFAYRRRGTPAGLEKLIQDYADVQVKVLEHFRLRRWPLLSVASPLDGSVRLWSRDFYRQLQLDSYSQVGYFRLTSRPEPALEPLDWGAHKFTVFFPADPNIFGPTEQKVAHVVEREKPAHTEATLCPVFPRFRVGVQATVGVDSVVAGISNLVLNRSSTLNYDSILACSKMEQDLRARGSAMRPQIGMTTKLP